MKKLISKNLNRTLWVWHIEKKDWSKLVKLCQDNKIKTIYLANPTKQSIEYFNKWGIGVEYLIGQQSPITIKKIIKTVKQAHNLNIKVHFDLEYSGEDKLSEYLDDLEIILSNSEIFGKPNFDVEPWINDNRYYKLINKYCDIVCLMNYSDKWYKQFLYALQALYKLNIPFYIGVETNPELPKISYLNKKDFTYNTNLLDKFAQWYFRYKGVAIHHWWTFKNLK